MIAVGATRYDETLAYYSNFGLSIDLVAPGGDLTVDQNGDGYGDGVLQNTCNPNTERPSTFGYWFFQGTSMASPHVSGTAALVISNGNATAPDDVRAALESSADVTVQDWGVVNAASALEWTQGPGPTATNTPVPPPTATNTPVPDTPADIVTITSARYDERKSKLDVRATSSLGGSVILTATAFDAARPVGSVTLKYEAKKDRHKGKITELEFKPVRV